MSSMLVMIPAFNEAAKIAGVVRNIHAVCPDSDILVINDGSKDRTGQVAASEGAIVVSHPFNMGYGVAIQTGYKYACQYGYDSLVQIDGDGQHDPRFIPELLSPIERKEADLVIGSRFLHQESYTPPLIRRIGMTVFRRIVSWIIGSPITDATSGYQAFNRKVMQFFSTDMFPWDYPDADVLIALHLAGFRIKEVPVKMDANMQQKSMHQGLKPLYYVFKMGLSIGVTLLRNHQKYRETLICQ